MAPFSGERADGVSGQGSDFLSQVCIAIQLYQGTTFAPDTEKSVSP